MSSAGHGLAIIDFRVGCSFDVQDSNQSALEQRDKSVVDKDVVAGDIELELRDGRAACRNGDGLHALRRCSENAAENVNPVEDFPELMQGQRKLNQPNHQ